MCDLLAPFQPSLRMVIIMLQLFQHKILCIAGLMHTSELHIPLLIYPKAPESCSPRISWCCSLVNAMDLLTQTLYIPGLLLTLMLILPLYAWPLAVVHLCPFCALEGCFLLDQKLWMSSGPNRPVNFSPVACNYVFSTETKTLALGRGHTSKYDLP